MNDYKVSKTFTKIFCLVFDANGTFIVETRNLADKNNLQFSMFCNFRSPNTDGAATTAFDNSTESIIFANTESRF